MDEIDGDPPLTLDDIRDESDPLVCELQVGTRQIVQDVKRAAAEGKTLEDLMAAMMPHFDAAG